MSIVFTSFKHPKLPISIKIPVTLLQIVYICMTAIPASCVVVTLCLLGKEYGTPVLQIFFKSGGQKGPMEQKKGGHFLK